MLLLTLVLLCQTPLLGIFYPKPLSPHDELIKKICAGEFELAEKHLACNKLCWSESREVDKAVLDAKTKAEQSQLTIPEKIRALCGYAWLAVTGAAAAQLYEESQDKYGNSKADQWRLAIISGMCAFNGLTTLYKAFTKQPSKQHYQKMLAIAKLRDDAAKRH